MPRDMHAMKQYLFSKYGKRCEICGKEFDEKELTGHHIIMKSQGGEIVEDNILIACYQCHFGVINHLNYDSEEYWALMRKALEHRWEK